jgi:hypothetical protein
MRLREAILGGQSDDAGGAGDGSYLFVNTALFLLLLCS